jgi:plasmid stabilization system protein ParE
MTLRIRFHPSIYSDVDKVMSYYEKVAGPQLADDFYAEFIAFVQEAAKDPDIFNIRIRDLRRVNLERFPYNFIFRVSDDTIRILVLRHHTRRPSFGLRRK